MAGRTVSAETTRPLVEKRGCPGCWQCVRPSQPCSTGAPCSLGSQLSWQLRPVSTSLPTSPSTKSRHHSSIRGATSASHRCAEPPLNPFLSLSSTVSWVPARAGGRAEEAERPLPSKGTHARRHAGPQHVGHAGHGPRLAATGSQRLEHRCGAALGDK